jgi:hypothetical protein
MMMNVLLAIDIPGDVSFRHPWPRTVLALLVALAVLVPVFLYARERALSPVKRAGLSVLRVLLFLLLLLLLLEPVTSRSRKKTVPGNILVLIDNSESMAFKDDRKRLDDLNDAAIALDKMGFRDHTFPDAARSVVASASRFDLARGILQHPDLKFFRDPGAKNRLRFFTFGDRVEPGPEKSGEFRDWLRSIKAEAPSTRLGDALQQATERYTGQPVAGIVVLTDGANNEGTDPLEVARSLHVPIIPIGLGLPRPEDVRLVAATLPETVFPKDKVPVRIQLGSTPGFVGREVTVTIHHAGKELDKKTVKLAGGMQFEELSFVPTEKSGTLKLDIAVSSLPGEASEENNKLTRSVKMIDEKIRVLFVEGRPRWEFRYLRAVLERDHRMIVKFLLTEGDKELPQVSDKYIDRFPEDEASAFKYDLVILGDVPADFLTPAQMSWLEKLVREKGGSFLMLAGQRYAPMSYVGSDVAKLLPVKLVAAGRQVVAAEVHPAITPAGKLSQIMSLETTDEENRAAWSLVKPLFDLPRVDGAKQGATVLATLSDQVEKADAYPLIAWQRYGSGKSMFVATDKLWRLRYKRGDTYHATFWSQAIQFLTLSRLLGENKRVRLESERKQYRTGERVLIQATVLDNEYKPIKADSYSVLVDQVPPRGEPRALTLKAIPAQEGLYQGFLRADQGGNFQVRPLPADETLANRAEFIVEAVSREKLEPDMQKETLEKLAELSGGKYLTMRDLPTLPDLFPDQSRTMTLPPQETELWNSWIVFAVILLLCGGEWFLRRSNDVA